MENIIKDEEVILDGIRLKTFNEHIKRQINQTINKNTYKEIRQRVNEYILKNNPSIDVVDSFNDFLKDCEGYYINK